MRIRRRGDHAYRLLRWCRRGKHHSWVWMALQQSFHCVRCGKKIYRPIFVPWWTKARAEAKRKASASAGKLPEVKR